MPIVHATLLFSGSGTDISPADSVSNSILGAWLSFGAVAIIAFIVVYLYILPGKRLDKVREEARADLLEENQRLRGENAAQKAELKELQDFVRNQSVPAVTQLTAVASSLVPLLQANVWQQRGDDDHGRERR